MTTDRVGPARATVTVLVVEAAAFVRLLACDILDVGGFKSLQAANTREALALLVANPDIGILLTDIDMPGEMNGLNLAHRVALRRPQVEIVVASGALKPRAGDLPPAARFLSKPFTPWKLLNLMAELSAQAVTPPGPERWL
jgi:CheY-like chemotaxis protein